MNTLVNLSFVSMLSLKTTGISEDLPVQTPAFTNAVRLYRQAKGHYGTWDMMCGQPPQVRTSVQFFDITHLYEYNMSGVFLHHVQTHRFPSEGEFRSDPSSYSVNGFIFPGKFTKIKLVRACIQQKTLFIFLWICQMPEGV